MTSNISALFEKLKNAFGFLRREGKRRTTVFLVQLAIVLGIGMILIFLMGHSLSQTTKKIIEARNQMVAQQQRIGALNTLKQGRAEIQEVLPQVYGLLPSDENLGEIIIQIDKVSDAYALKTTTRIGDKISDASGIFVPLTITTQGSLDTLKRYLRALEELPFLLKVQSLEFKGELKQPGDTTIKLILFIR